MPRGGLIRRMPDGQINSGTDPQSATFNMRELNKARRDQIPSTDHQLRSFIFFLRFFTAFPQVFFQVGSNAVDVRVIAPENSPHSQRYSGAD
jgi:hypothetical protein